MVSVSLVDINCIRDPANFRNNIAHKIGSYQLQRIKQEFNYAYHIIKSTTNNENIFKLLTQPPILISTHLQPNIMQQNQYHSYLNQPYDNKNVGVNIFTPNPDAVPFALDTKVNPKKTKLNANAASYKPLSASSKGSSNGSGVGSSDALHNKNIDDDFCAQLKLKNIHIEAPWITDEILESKRDYDEFEKEFYKWSKRKKKKRKNEINWLRDEYKKKMETGYTDWINNSLQKDNMCDSLYNYSNYSNNSNNKTISISPLISNQSVTTGDDTNNCSTLRPDAAPFVLNGNSNNKTISISPSISNQSVSTSDDTNNSPKARPDAAPFALDTKANPKKSKLNANAASHKPSGLNASSKGSSNSSGHGSNVGSDDSHAFGGHNNIKSFDIRNLGPLDNNILNRDHHKNIDYDFSAQQDQNLRDSFYNYSHNSNNKTTSISLSISNQSVTTNNSSTLRPDAAPFVLNNPSLTSICFKLRQSKLSADICNFYAQNNNISVSKQIATQQFIEHIKKMIYKLPKNLRKVNHFNTINKWDLFIFGSEAWNLRCENSDIDIGIKLPFVPTRKMKIDILKHLMQILNKNKTIKCTSILHARYPIIKTTKKSANGIVIECDISIADEFCLKTKKIITDIINKYDKFFIKELITFVKCWSKQRGINNAFKRYLNSFGYTILVITFMNYYIMIKKIDTNLSILVYKFFFFYSNIYDDSKHSIRVDHYNTMNNYEIFDRKKNNEFVMEIIDPANDNNNIAKNVGRNEYVEIKQEFQRGYKICNDFVPLKNFKSLFHRLTEKKY